MKTQHQRPEFGHKQGENKKNLKMKKARTFKGEEGGTQKSHQFW
jgi:hypothetical protein